ncbi:hypothetical protein [Streptomyces alanosinicus]|uniref:Uncharacterized protein n=1 Tax=Streptomyces alanosinicus TaxID=68171 RepID=A0A918YS78_9ACTN|nr:hypothetical protein [Streptomyces alanosinicus]GHE14725.1 hypothetical protein GCM10010339_86600 [Streptomyces alanosinicus]
MLRAQHLILESVHNGTADFGPYTHKPVADFLPNVRTLSRIIPTHPDHQELARQFQRTSRTPSPAQPSTPNPLHPSPAPFCRTA